MSRTTEMTLTPAEPIGTSSASSSAASASTKAGGRVRETAMRGRSDVRWGTTGGAAVLNVSPKAGCATAPATSSPPDSFASHSATCTAQSSRGTSENSRVPSSGSTIHTRLADRRALSSLPSSESTESPGRWVASSFISSSWAAWSPASLSSRPSRPWPRTSSRRSPATVASHSASTWSSAPGGGVRSPWLFVTASP